MYYQKKLFVQILKEDYSLKYALEWDEWLFYISFSQYFHLVQNKHQSLKIK